MQKLEIGLAQATAMRHQLPAQPNQDVKMFLECLKKALVEAESRTKANMASPDTMLDPLSVSVEVVAQSIKEANQTWDKLAQVMKVMGK